MKTILVVGDRESGKDDLLEFVLDRGKGALPDHGYLKFDDYLVKDAYNAYNTNIGGVRKFQRDFQRKVARRFEELKAKHENIIINAHFFARLRCGFVSLLNVDMFNTFKPDAVIIIELYPRKPDPRFKMMLKKREQIDLKALKLEQDMIRKFATLYTSSNDSILKFVQVEEDNVNAAFREIMDTVTFVLRE